MGIMIFHGSEHIIEKPEYGKGRVHNDYGQGFYCTEHLELAKEWACTSEHGGYANKYTIDMRGLDVLDLNSDRYNILNWLAILLDNRRFDADTEIAYNAREYLLEYFLPDYKNADIITGYRADDSYFTFARDFIENGLSIRQLGKAMHLGDLGIQIMVRSKKAFERLNYEGYEIAEKEEYYRRRKMRDDKARAAYRSERTAGTELTEEIYLMDIIRQGWRNGDVHI